MTDKLRTPYKDYLLSVDVEAVDARQRRMRIVDMETEDVLVYGAMFGPNTRPDVKTYVGEMMMWLKQEIGKPETETFEDFIDRLDAAISKSIQEAYGA